VFLPDHRGVSVQHVALISGGFSLSYSYFFGFATDKVGFYCGILCLFVVGILVFGTKLPKLATENCHQPLRNMLWQYMLLVWTFSTAILDYHLIYALVFGRALSKSR
jgi:hypothetical protein